MQQIYNYDLLKRPGEGLALFRSAFGQQVFTVVRLRKKKHGYCMKCGGVLGARAYRPLTNLSNRSHRICLACSEAIALQERTAL